MDGDETKSKVETSVDDDRAVHEIVRETFNADVSNSTFQFQQNPATFLNLNLYVKSMILKMLDLGSQCNLSIVWEDMNVEFWKSVDVDRRITSINSIEELEYAGVLATGGKIDTVEELNLKYVNVSSIPVNIINNVMKIVNNSIFLDGVLGWRTSMLDDVKCHSLMIRDMDLKSGSDGRPFRVDVLRLYGVGGDLSGLFGNLYVDQGYNNLSLSGIDISVVPNDTMNRLFKSFNGSIELGALTGFKSSMLNDVNCRSLELHSGVQCSWDDKNSKQMMISDLTLYKTGDISGILDNLKSCDTFYLGQIYSSLNLVEMLNGKVSRLQTWWYEDQFPDWLSKYNGQGKCSEIRINVSGKNYLNNYKAWAKARGWKSVKVMSTYSRYATLCREFLLMR